jgi:phospholipid transport system substrate-binding protein
MKIGAVLSKVFLSLGLMMCALPSAADFDDKAPQPIIEYTTSRIMTIIDDAPTYFDDDPDRFYAEIGEVLDATIDWRGFAKGVMGQYASTARYKSLDANGKKALREQLKTFTGTIKSGLIRTYGKGLLAFSGSKFEIIDGGAVDENARSASITQLVYGSGGRTYTVRYQMGKRRDGTWRLRNLIVEDINLGQIYQNQFAAAAKAANGDVAKVIAEWDIAENLPEDLDDE